MHPRTEKPANVHFDLINTARNFYKRAEYFNAYRIFIKVFEESNEGDFYNLWAQIGGLNCILAVKGADFEFLKNMQKYLTERLYLIKLPRELVQDVQLYNDMLLILHTNNDALEDYLYRYAEFVEKIISDNEKLYNPKYIVIGNHQPAIEQNIVAMKMLNINNPEDKLNVLNKAIAAANLAKGSAVLTKTVDQAKVLLALYEKLIARIPAENAEAADCIRQVEFLRTELKAKNQPRRRSEKEKAGKVQLQSNKHSKFNIGTHFRPWITKGDLQNEAQTPERPAIKLGTR